ncbi:MAG: hypothetical protein VX644_06605 [Planctomycetota bacterium]|nr:hypothetical protein [Planctomycetota bacterium]
MHTIRLHGPWNYLPLCRTTWTAEGTSIETEGVVPPGGRLNMPADWQSILGNDFFGRVRFERHFHCPTGLTEQDQVFIAIEQVDALGSVQLNGQHLGDIPATAGPTRFDITILLQQRNRLEVVVDLPLLHADSAPLERPGREQLAGGLIGEVALQIESPDHE